MIPNSATFVVLAEHEAGVGPSGPSRPARTASDPGQGRLRRLVRRVTAAPGFLHAWSPPTVSPAAVDPRPAHSSQG